jgi:hypothetical protein
VTPVDILHELARLGVRIENDGEAPLRIVAPKGRLTDSLKAAIRKNLQELHRELSKPAQAIVVHSLANQEPDGPKCTRCGSTDRVEVPIHAGRSIRRDCGKCGFPCGHSVWYGKPVPPEEFL